MRISFKDVSFGYTHESRHLFRRKRSMVPQDENWVLKDMTFDVIEGDRFGIIGSNGSGKTTLLRMAAGILKPDKGLIGLANPTTSLISSSFGIDVELTGRENIYKKARYMGYSRQETHLKLDEIVDFSGLKAHLDKPVRSYSDGMRVRLSSSIALMLSTGCIIMDEGIAAADLEFSTQVEKSMKEFYKQIPIVIIASHSLSFVESICQKVGYLKNGNFDFVGSPTEAWGRYVKDVYKL